MSSDRSKSLALNRVSFAEILGHALANITPSAMATVTISLVVAAGGLWTWAVYLVVGIVMLFVAWQVAVLAKAVPSAGSLFVSVGTLWHPWAGVLCGWSMMGGYLGALLAAPVIGGVFMTKALAVMGLTVSWAPIALAFAGLAWWLAVRDVELATRYSLYVELISLFAILVIGFITLAHSGFVDRPQWHAPFLVKPFLGAMTLSVLAYGGFETAANLGREGRAPRRTVPRAIVASVLLSLMFYVFMAYAEMSGFGNVAGVLAHTPAPLNTLAMKAGLPILAVVSDGAMAIAAWSATIATLNSLSRILYSMGRHRLFPSSFGTVGAAHTPVIALHVLGAMTTLFAVIAGLAGWPILTLVGLFGVFTALGFIVIYIVAMWAVVMTHSRGRRPVPVMAMLTAVVATPLLAYVFFLNFQGNGLSRAAAYGFLVYTAIGVAVYRILDQRIRGVRSTFNEDRADD